MSVTLTVQLAPAPKAPLQLFVWAKSPLEEITILAGVIPLFVREKLFAELVEFTACAPRFKLEGEALIAIFPWETKKGIAAETEHALPAGKFCTKI